MSDYEERPTRAEIRLGALRRNFGRARELAGPRTKVMAVVKANAYGHGMLRVAKELLAEGAGYLGVAIVEEAVVLRDAGIEAPILVLGAPTAASFKTFALRGIDASIVSVQAARAASEAALAAGRKIKAHLKIDTGMGRIGVRWDVLEPFLEEVAALEGLEIVGVFSHLATADCDPAFALEQASRFRKALDLIEKKGMRPPLAHLANSAALVTMPELRYEMVRPGIFVYGYEPSPYKAAGVEPVMRLVSELSFVKRVLPGEGVSYGQTWKAPIETTIGTIPIGYGDGYSRSLSNRATVRVGGKERQIVGRICMDQVMVDLGPGSVAAAGDGVLLFGERAGELVPGESLCEILGTIPYELTCMVGERVPRVYVED